MSHADVNGLSLYYDICAAPGLAPAVVAFLDARGVTPRQPSVSGSTATRPSRAPAG